MLPSRWTRPPWRNIETTTERSTFFSGKRSGPASPHTVVSISEIVNGSPDFSSQATAAFSYKKSSMSVSVPDIPFCHPKKTRTFAAISPMVMIGKILVGLISRIGNMAPTPGRFEAIMVPWILRKTRCPTPTTPRKWLWTLSRRPTRPKLPRWPSGWPDP
jgi:hypothetical protein